MKIRTKAVLAAIVLTLTTWVAGAQDAGRPPARGERPPRGEGPQMDGQRRPPVPPLVAALDANHDGVIDEQEIANASAALKTLDKNGDGKLTVDELRPPGRRGPGRGPRGPRGPEDEPPAEN